VRHRGEDPFRVLLAYLRRKAGLSKNGPGAERRVLLIEEEPRVANVVSRGLVVDGYEVVVAEDGEVGVFLAETEPFDLIVLDLALAEAPGLEILERIRGGRADTPIVVLSDRDDPHARRAAHSAGASEFVAKPLVVEALRASVEQQLARRG
jgi:two-component system, OmpR family, response regulator MprA